MNVPSGLRLTQSATGTFGSPLGNSRAPPCGMSPCPGLPCGPSSGCSPYQQKRKSPRLQTEYLPYRIACRTMEHLRTQDVRCLTGARTLVFQSRNMKIPDLKKTPRPIELFTSLVACERLNRPRHCQLPKFAYLGNLLLTRFLSVCHLVARVCARTPARTPYCPVR